MPQKPTPPMMNIPKNDGYDEALAYDEFLKLIRDFRAGRIDIRGVQARVNTLLLPTGKKVEKVEDNSQLLLKGKKVKKVEENYHIPWDVLDIISKTLDFDDLFQFAGVCKNWRGFHKIYWRNFLTSFLASQEPLALQVSYKGKVSFSFISIPDQKVYCSKRRMEYLYRYNYVTSSSGYFIMAGFNNNPFMIINPFKRKKKVVNTHTFESNPYLIDRALFAFDKCSEEFVFVVLYEHHLHVYQSRDCGWVTYSTMGNSGRVIDFAVLHNIIYVVTDKANIGVLSLNSANMKFIDLKSTPDVTFSFGLGLVNCDEQLLVVDLMFNKIRNVYKIDFSTMSYVKLETLGDIALFYFSSGFKRNCYGLRNPNRWGYESNSVYFINSLSNICHVYLWDDKKLQKCITLPTPYGTNSHMVDWCFRHIQYEIDYYLVE